MTLDELNQHFDLVEKLKTANEMLESMRSAAEPGAQKITGMPHASGARDMVGMLAIEIVTLEESIADLKKEVAYSEPYIKAFIDGIDDLQLRMAFRLRFLHAVSWKETAGLLGGGNTEYSVKSMCYRYIDLVEQKLQRDDTR